MSASPPQQVQQQPLPHNQPYTTGPAVAASGVHYVSQPEYSTDHVAAGPSTADMSGAHVHHHHQQPQHYAPEMEQNTAAPQLFSIETYYWNDFQAAATYGQHVGGYYQQPQQNPNSYPAEASGGVYNSIVQHLQQEDPSRMQ